MKANITVSIDTDCLVSRDDAQLAALWFVSQLNPASTADADACGLVRDIGAEIIRRWLASAPALLHDHQPGMHYWHTLVAHGSWTGPGRTWQPDPEKLAQQAALRAQEGGAA
jgi:hypothetical protein